MENLKKRTFVHLENSQNLEKIQLTLESWTFKKMKYVEPNMTPVKPMTPTGSTTMSTKHAGEHMTSNKALRTPTGSTKSGVAKSRKIFPKLLLFLLGSGCVLQQKSRVKFWLLPRVQSQKGRCQSFVICRQFL